MIVVVDYHKGNLKSVERGLITVGADAHSTDEVDEIKRADAIVLPGVGAFADAANSMRELGQDEVIVERIQEGVPFLGICLGLHLLFTGGTEHAEGKPTPGLGLIPGVVDALPKTDMAGNPFKIPHVGWNTVDFLSKRPNPLFKGIKDREFFYFTHSYALSDDVDPGVVAARTDYTRAFPSAIWNGGNLFAVQFHPEKSSDAGLKLLSNFVEIAENA